MASTPSPRRGSASAWRRLLLSSGASSDPGQAPRGAWLAGQAPSAAATAPRCAGAWVDGFGRPLPPTDAWLREGLAGCTDGWMRREVRGGAVRSSGAGGGGRA
eukprot:scaffold957_cov402-Prasinococcus_capsulatus_cf.AAC.15